MKEEAFPLHQKCSMIPLSTTLSPLVSSFSCGEEDLDEFLKENAIPHGEDHLTTIDDIKTRLMYFDLKTSHP